MENRLIPIENRNSSLISKKGVNQNLIPIYGWTSEVDSHEGERGFGNRSGDVQRMNPILR